MLKYIQKLFLYTLQAILFFGICYSLFRKEYLHAILIAGILFLTYLPFIFRTKFHLYLPMEIEAATIIFIFLSFFLGDFQGYYYRFWWWDIMLHLSSGFLLGIVGFMLIYMLNQEKHIRLKMAPSFVALFSFAFALAIGAVWEIVEFILDRSLGLNMQKSGLVDTMFDLIVDAVGALVVSAIGFLYMKYRTRSYIFDSIIQRLIEKNPHHFKKRPV